MWASSQNSVQLQPALHHSSELLPVFLAQQDQNSCSSMDYDEGHQILELGASPAGSSLSFAMSPDSGYGGDEVYGAKSSTSAPYLTMEEEPEGSYRFRYEKESQKPHGPLKGRNSIGKTQKNSNGPRVKLNNFEGEAIIRCWLHCHIDEEGPSPHRLVQAVGRNPIENEPFDLPVCRSNDYTASFDRMNILHVVVKDEPYQTHYLEKKKRLGRPGSIISHPDRYKGKIVLNDRAQKEVKAHLRKIDKDICRLRFEAYQRVGDEYHFICSTLSAPIKNKKSPKTNGPRIIKASHVEGPCTGGTGVFIFTEKLIKDVRIIFFDEDGWEGDAVFRESDIHKQVAVAFKTPAYNNPQITEPVTVFYKIRRTTDDEESNVLEFRYLPTEDNMFLSAFLEAPLKRKKPQVTTDVVINDRMLSESSGRSEIDDTDLLNLLSYKTPGPDEYGNTLSDVSTGDLIQDSLPLRMYGYSRDSIPTKNIGSETPAKEPESLAEKARRLQISIIKNDEAAFAQLISTPHIVNFKYNNQTALHCAVRCQRPSMVSKLLEAKANINELDLSGSNTPVHLAILSASDTCLQLLLRYAADRKAVFNKDGDDPVLLATRNGNKNALNMLLLQGFPASCDNKKNGDTPLHVAVENCIKSGGSMEIVNLLLKFGACASEFNYAGETPLHAAVAAQHRELVRKLILSSDVNDFEGEENDVDELSSKLQLLGLTEDEAIKTELQNFLSSNDSPAEEKTSSDDGISSPMDQLKLIGGRVLSFFK